eukprot:m.202144 g.202144  ORF g.202144 m.202144 type:complete len:231 (+) comp18817_c0_seq1:300-992(+)
MDGSAAVIEEPMESGVQEYKHNPPCFVLLHSVAKRHNGSAIIRTAVAMGVHEIVMAGSDKFSTFGCQGSDVFMKFKHFQKLEDAVSYLKHEHHCDIVGVEITDDAKSLRSAPFKGPTAFVLGNEGHGLDEKELAICDWCVYIPHHGVGTASLNVANATAIILYGFAQWAQYAEAPREGYKYVVGQRPQKRAPRGRVAADPGAIAAERARKRESAQAEDDGNDAFALFDGD